MAKILVIDDDISSRFLVKKVLEKNSHEVLEAENGVDGLRLLKGNPDIKLVLLDLIMPVMNGQDFLKAIMQEGINVPVVVLSTDDEKAKESKFQGAKEYMVKPVKPIELLDIVAKYV